MLQMLTMTEVFKAQSTDLACNLNLLCKALWPVAVRSIG